MCDKAFAQCISAYQCPYDEKTHSAEKSVKNEIRYLTPDECHTNLIDARNEKTWHEEFLLEHKPKYP